ncbi:MAG: hydroxylamine oxidase [Planctomycetes bacterium]|nr:hydroxylamine oxidase [Planctomycetota bacterium]MBI3845518.1 hydroxylamine oxidase [Planctomycetota bacterium]
MRSPRALLGIAECFVVVLTSSVAAAQPSEAPAAPISKQSQACIECHEQVTPGIVADWRTSRHSRITPEAAAKKPALERRISSTDVPESLRSVAVGCFECHGLNPAAHKDNFKHEIYQINVIVSPNDCKTCHATEVEQYGTSKKAHARGNLAGNPVFHGLAESVNGVQELRDGKLVSLPSSDMTQSESCFGCHGSEVVVRGMKTVKSDFGDYPVPDLANWPNHGVGRVNPDGSLGACTSCHPRHSFSIAVARQAHTCGQCHLSPDVPALEVWEESKHGNIVQSLGHEYDWDAVPWVVGRDFRAPTCAACHNALLASPTGDVIVQRSHDFGARLWVRLFGLPYAHPQPKSGDTSIIRNKDGQPLPTTLDGEVASEFLLDVKEQAARQGEMRKVCRACHSTSFADAHFARLANTITETNAMTLTATKLLKRAWDGGLADRSNLFDEPLEKKWVRQWLFYANSVRYASAMSGPDYVAFKNGWWDLSENLRVLDEAIRAKSPPEHR